MPSAKEINRRLHSERIVRGSHRRRLHELPWGELPDGAFVALEGGPALVLGDRLVEWTTAGYGERAARPRRGRANTITPPVCWPCFGPATRSRSMPGADQGAPAADHRQRSLGDDVGAGRGLLVASLDQQPLGLLAGAGALEGEAALQLLPVQDEDRVPTLERLGPDTRPPCS